MGWSLELFLKQFIFLNWITKDEAKVIEDNANVPLCTLFVKMDTKFHSDEDKITGLMDELTTFKEQNESYEKMYITMHEQITKLSRKNEVLRKTVEFYGDDRNYSPEYERQGTMGRHGKLNMFIDGGQRAKKCLEEIERVKND